MRRLVLVKCPRCGAGFNVPDTIYYAVCPYCGTVLKIGAEGVEESNIGHFYYPINQRDPYRDLIEYIYREGVVPDDFIDNSDLRDRKLYYIPLYSYYVEGDISLYRLDKHITTYHYGDYVAVPAADAGIVSKLLAPWDTALEGKRFYTPDIREMGIYYEPAYHPLDSAWLAELVYKWWAMIRVKRELGEFYWCDPAVTSTEFTFVVHYPVWWIKYCYRERFYEAYVDGVDNRVIVAEYPVTRGKKLSVIGYSLALVGATALVTMALTSALTSRVPLVSSLKNLIAISTGLVAGLSGYTVFSEIRLMGRISSIWSEEEIESMYKVFVEFPY